MINNTKQAIVNRTLIRKKVLQCIYEYVQNDDKTGFGTKMTEKQMRGKLDASIEQSYSLYNYLLLLICDVTALAYRKIDAAMHKNLPTEEDLHPNRKFVDNRFAADIAKNVNLKEYMEGHKFSWIQTYPEVVEKMYVFIKESKEYKEYMGKETSTYEEDKEFWRSMLKTYLLECDDLDTAMEDYSVYWNDDIGVVASFVLKTIRNYDEGEIGQGLYKKYKDGEDEDFGGKLLVSAVKHYDEYEKMISENIVNWDMDRVAMVDKLIIVLAITEFMNFPTIPVNVTMNEYIELTKSYSSDKAPSFINGVLDRIASKLASNNMMIKAKVLSKD